MKILIVDDEPGVLKLNCRLMTLAGFEAVPARDGVEAWDLYRAGVYPVVLTDLDMPEMDGYELIERIQGSPQGEETNIVVLSGSGAEPEAIEALSETVFACLRKPVVVAELLGTISRAAGGSQQVDALVKRMAVPLSPPVRPREHAQV